MTTVFFILIWFSGCITALLSGLGPSDTCRDAPTAVGAGERSGTRPLDGDGPWLGVSTSGPANGADARTEDGAGPDNGTGEAADDRTGVGAGARVGGMIPLGWSARYRLETVDNVYSEYLFCELSSPETW